MTHRLTSTFVPPTGFLPERIDPKLTSVNGFLRGPGFSVRYERESAAVAIAR
jgi:hypothetical protein